jgi:hypothetical protein
MLRRVDEPALHLAHSDQSRTRRKPQGPLVERRRGQSLPRLRDANAPAQLSCLAVQSVDRQHTGKIRLAGTCAQSPVVSPMRRVCTRPPARNGGPALVSGRPQRAWPAATQLPLRGQPSRALRGPGQWADSLGPPAARRPWAPAAGPPSAVTEVGCRWSSRPLAAVGNSPRPIS